ncbi:MAG: sorbosone dehydrogenase family protein [Spirochaetota bacterium]|nr:MAG: sorbosone dehydrogenase family protein [Spirochaetota bacterium]
MKRLQILLIFLFTLAAFSSYALPLDKIKLPPNFHIELFAKGIETARGMAFSDNGTLFVGSKNGKVYAITSHKKQYIIAQNLEMPVGLDFFNKDLLVSAVSRVIKFEDIEDRLENPPKSIILNDTLPKERHHGWKFIKVGPDKKLYVPVGAPCNVCLRKDKRFATIMRMNIDGSNPEIFAEGVRNTVGFDWHPETQELWFTDNGRDWMGDDFPPDELNRAPARGLHFGFPFLHGKNIKDPDFWSKRQHSSFILPEYELPAHVAALGMRFYTGSMFPPQYRGGIFIAEHGSWNRSKKTGYRISFVEVKENKALNYKIFASGWVENEKSWGRPADVEIGPDGSLYVSDDKANSIYRIFYDE